jgi:hypothetical protein
VVNFDNSIFRVTGGRQTAESPAVRRSRNHDDLATCQAAAYVPDVMTGFITRHHMERHLLESELTEVQRHDISYGHSVNGSTTVSKTVSGGSNPPGRASTLCAKL